LNFPRTRERKAMASDRKNSITFGSARDGIEVTVTTDGIVVTGWFDSIVSMGEGRLTWDDLFKLAPKSAFRKVKSALNKRFQDSENK